MTTEQPTATSGIGSLGIRRSVEGRTRAGDSAAWPPPSACTRLMKTGYALAEAIRSIPRNE
jgi:hypothetical protein